MNTKVIAIVGPTASGKTGLSIKLAKKYNGEVISADSRQVYRGLDIGTEKITKDEMADVPHHLIDVSDPKDVFSVKDFKEMAGDFIEKISERGNLPFVVGGTGFYIDTLLYGLEFPEVSPNEMLRKELEEKDTVDLFSLVMEKDPIRATTIDPNNRRRLIRSLEIIEELGSVPISNKKESVYDVLLIGIKTDEETLKERIEKRLLETINKGLVDEVKSLKDSGVSWERLEEFGLEYKIVSQFLRNEIDDVEMYRNMVHALRQYSKRQKTWFKRNKDIHWFTLDEFDAMENTVDGFLKRV